MSALKFECPACGQHLECERALSGDVIHCPRCCAELRIPFSSLPGEVVRAELIMHAPGAKPAAAPTAPSPTAPVPSVPEVREVICPVCESQLRMRSGAPKHDGQPPLAELIKKGEPKVSPEPARETSPPAETHPDLSHMSFEERERHIAAAREAHPIQLNKPVKPRLSYVLSGKSPMEEKREKEEKHDSQPPFSE